MFLDRAGEKPEQFAMDTHPPDRSAHQQQQPQPTPSWNRQAPSPGLPESVLQQTTQPASRTRQHGVSQVKTKRKVRGQRFRIPTAIFDVLWEIVFSEMYSNNVGLLRNGFGAILRVEVVLEWNNEWFKKQIFYIRSMSMRFSLMNL